MNDLPLREAWALIDSIERLGVFPVINDKGVLFVGGHAILQSTELATLLHSGLPGLSLWSQVRRHMKTIDAET